MFHDLPLCGLLGPAFREAGRPEKASPGQGWSKDQSIGRDYTWNGRGWLERDQQFDLAGMGPNGFDTSESEDMDLFRVRERFVKY